MTQPLEAHLSLLLSPISNSEPCGEFLRYADVYDQIREARREDDESLPQGVWKTEVKKADWEQVSTLCQDILRNRSKDLQIAAWLTEAWLHLEGMAGLVRGLELVLGLSQNFWTTIHPQLNKGNYELRIVPYEWINMRLSEECHHIRISLPSDKDTTPQRLLDFNEAQRLNLLSKKNSSPELLSSLPHPSLDKIYANINKTPTEFYKYMNKNCILSLKLITDLETELRFHLEGEAPTFYRLREKVEAVQRFASQVLDKRGEKKTNKKENSNVENLSSHPSKKPSPIFIENREHAYGILGEVATYLERIEPHSPTPYLIRRAITWGHMSLPQVFADTLSNSKDLSLLLDMLNVDKIHQPNAE